MEEITLQSIPVATEEQIARLAELRAIRVEQNYPFVDETKEERKILRYLITADMFRNKSLDDNVDQKADDNYQVQALRYFNAYLKLV